MNDDQTDREVLDHLLSSVRFDAPPDGIPEDDDEGEDD